MNQVGAHQVTRIVDAKTILVESKFIWEIKNWPALKETTLVESSRIEIPDVDGHWWITLFPKLVDGADSNERNKTVFNFTLKMRPEALRNSKYEYEVLCMTPDRNLPNSRRKVFQFPSTPIDNEIMTASEYIRAATVLSSCSKINSYIMDFKVTIKFLGSNSIRSKSYDPYANNNEILSNVRSLYSNAEFADFTFIVKDKEFKIHKNILAASSSVMRKMFTTNMEESRTNRCKLDHIEPDVFEKLLECIYKGKLPDDFADHAKELYSVADYYGIEWVKELCRMETSERLDLSNALQVYKWACRYELDDLKMEAWEILKR